MKLSVKSGKAGKIHIYIDDEYRMTCDSNFWYSEKWHNLTEINEEELALLECSVSSRRAFIKGSRLLERRLHSKSELITKLQKDFASEYANYAADKLEELRLIDDERFAEIYAEELYNRKKYAPKRILMELKAKGIDSEIAKNAVNALDKEDFNRIILLLNSKYKNKLSDEKSVNRTVNALLRMGYGYGDIKKAIGQVAEDFDGDDYE